MCNLNKHHCHIGALDISIDISELSVHSHYQTQALSCLQSKYQEKKATNGGNNYGKEHIKKMKGLNSCLARLTSFGFISAYLYTQVPIHI